MRTMKLLILGSGTCIPHAERTAPGLLLEQDGLTALIDPGPGAVHKLARYGADYRQINELWITHPHLDHHADLIPLLFARKHAFEPLPELVIRSGMPFEKILRSLESIYEEWIKSELALYHFEPLEPAGGRLETFGIRLKWLPVEHGDWAFALRIESGGKSLVYSGDSDYCGSLVELSQNVDLLVAECSFPDDRKLPGHMTPTEVARLADVSNAKKLVLVHLYPLCDPVSSVLNVIQKIYGGVVEIAEEGKTYSI